MKSICPITLALGILAVSVSGCGGASQGSGEAAPPAASAAAPADAAASYPIVEDGSIKLTYWLPLYPAVTRYMTNMDENYAYDEVQKRTGIDIQFIHPAAGQEKEQFNLLIASNSLPDILNYPQAYPGGEFQGMQDGMFLDITDKLPALAPDYYQLIQQNEEFFREMSDNNGRIVSFSAYKPIGDPPARRIILREDVLDELDAGIPETRADYEALYEKMLAAGIVPYLPTKLIYGVEPQFVSMFGIFAESTDADGLKFFKDENNTVQLGHILPEFKEYLTMMNDWYAKGYISKDFTSVDEQQANTLFDTRAVGMITGPVVAAYNRSWALFAARQNPALQGGYCPRYPPNCIRR